MHTDNELYELNVTHACGHVQTHPVSGDREWFLNYFGRQKCSQCHPMCCYCHRSGDREKMVVSETGFIFCNKWCEDQAAHATHYAEHNEIEIPPRLRHWRDDSYHNDLCGHSTYALENGDEITVWVDFKNPEDREDPSLVRFNVQFCPQGELNPDLDLLYEGNDEAQMELWAAAAETVVCGPDDDDDPAILPKIKMIREMMTKEDIHA